MCKLEHMVSLSLGKKLRSKGFQRALQLVIPPLLFLFTLLAWAIASPPGSTADADFHEVSILCQQGDRPGICSHVSKTQVKVSKDFAASLCYVRQIEDSAACYKEQAGKPGLITTDRWNYSYQYPPTYFSFHGLFVDRDLTTTVMRTRILNVLIVTTLVGLVAGFLPGRQRINLWLTILLTQMPLGLSVIASVNPSSWTLLAPTLVFFSLRGFLIRKKANAEMSPGLSVSSKVPWVLLCLTIASFLFGANARYDSVIFCILALCAALFTGVAPGSVRSWFRGKRLLVLIVGVLAIGAGAAAVIVRFMRKAVFIDFFKTLATGDSAAGQSREIIIKNIYNFPLFIYGFYGGSFGLGWLELGMPALVCLISVVLVSGMFFLGLQCTSWKENIATGLLLLAFLTIPLIWLYQVNVKVGDFVQPRYILPLFTLCVGTALFSFPVSKSLSRVQRWILCIGAASAHLVSLHVYLTRYWKGTEYIPGESTWWWDAWWVPGPQLTLILGILAYSALAVIVTVVLPKQTESRPNDIRGTSEHTRKETLSKI